jgi:hypothetical protein
LLLVEAEAKVGERIFLLTVFVFSCGDTIGRTALAFSSYLRDEFRARMAHLLLVFRDGMLNVHNEHPIHQQCFKENLSLPPRKAFPVRPSD